MMKKKRRYVPDLVAEMAECDANYIRLHRLFPFMKKEDVLKFGVDSPQSATSPASLPQGSIADCAIVSIKIEKRCPYTTMLTVKVTNEEDKPWVKWPQLEVRVYHDIKSAEVISFERHRNLKFRYATPNAQMYQPDEKSQINKFFGELLTYCYKYGRSLESVELHP